MPERRRIPPTPPEMEALVLTALAEDFGLSGPEAIAEARPGSALLARDVTTDSTVPHEARVRGAVVARQPLVVAGLPYARRSWTALAELVGVGPVTFTALAAEGDRVIAGASLATVEGPAAVVLGAERTALDFLMVLCGIATEAGRWQDAADEASRSIGRDQALVVTDTRKTVPGLRAPSKYAVAVGGAANHRAGLWDMVLVKDNHLRLAGGVSAAVRAARSRQPGLRVQIEADSVAQAVEAARAGADLVLLDNMDDAMLAEAVRAVRAATQAGGHCVTEASGRVTFERLPALAASGVDRVSTSKLTMASPVDVAFDLEDPGA